MLTKEWLQENYIDKNMTMAECGYLLDIRPGMVGYFANKFGLFKQKNGRYIDPKFNKRIGLKYSEEWKQNIKLGQPNAKKVVRISSKGGRKIYNNISEAAKENGLFRENVRACCYGRHHTAGGYNFAFVKTYGEEIVHRLNNLDFSLSLEQMMSGVYAGLPERMSKKEASKYYANKLSRYWGMSA